MNIRSRHRSRSPNWARLSSLSPLCLTLALGSACQTKDASDSVADTNNEDSGSSEDPSASAEGMESNGDGDPTGDGDPSATGFVPMTDAIGANTCDPAEQDCPDGEKCTAYVTMPGDCCVDANKCVDIIGDHQLGDPCTRMDDNDDCAEGLFCMTVTSGSEGEGVCLALCNVAEQDCAEDGLPDATCIAFNDGVLPMCQDSCDPITQDCDGALGCYGVGAQGFVCAIPGYEDGLGNDGDMCYTIQSCKPGLGCVAAEVLSDCAASRCCTPYCDLSEVDPCTQPEECVPYYEPGTAPPGYENTGLCAIPA